MGNDIREIAKTVVGLKELMDGMAWGSEEHITARRLLSAYLAEVRQFLPYQVPEPRP